ncbi:unnamed protein product [Rodentolepis nana]|uniref:ZM domain-containing protein n=1 Tax=Rodentolepis nana TaxID=102285 RepID=A0A0R3TCD4_RODNA|nr:unnamed protein product [Rodentolepis nana]
MPARCVSNVHLYEIQEPRPCTQWREQPGYVTLRKPTLTGPQNSNSQLHFNRQALTNRQASTRRKISTMDSRNQTSVQQERSTPIIAYEGTSNGALVRGPNTASLAQPARSTSIHEVHIPTAYNSNNPVSAVPTPIPPLPRTLLL